MDVIGFFWLLVQAQWQLSFTDGWLPKEVRGVPTVEQGGLTNLQYRP